MCMCKQRHLSVIYKFALIILPLSPSFCFCSNKDSWAWWVTFLFSFSFQGDDELLQDCLWRTVVDVVYVYDQSKECAQHNLRGNMFELAQNVQDSYMWNHKSYFSYMYVALVVFEQVSCHDFVLKQIPPSPWIRASMTLDQNIIRVNKQKIWWS